MTAELRHDREEERKQGRMLRRGLRHERVRESARVHESSSVGQEVGLHMEEEPVGESERSARASDGNTSDHEPDDADDREVATKSVPRYGRLSPEHAETITPHCGARPGPYGVAKFSYDACLVSVGAFGPPTMHTNGLPGFVYTGTNFPSRTRVGEKHGYFPAFSFGMPPGPLGSFVAWSSRSARSCHPHRSACPG